MKKDKTIVRVVKRENPFVQIDKTPINDERLSWKAKGLLVYLISKPDDWTIILNDLVNKAKDGRDSVYAGLKELEQAGYLSRVRERDSNGKFLPIEYRVYEIPQVTEPEPQQQPLPENPDTVNPATSGKSGYGKSRYGKSRSGKSNTTNNDSNKNHLPTNDSTNDDELLIQGGAAPYNPHSPHFEENKKITEEFVDYAVSMGIHKDFANDILQKLEKVEYRLSHYTVGQAVNKTLNAKEISHIPNYFMSVLENEIKRVQMKEGE
ncbi:helix-turn-helix domain-containing protein [Brevibacillus laterosporus]|uniref:helix-turn-helix domain-containing protein n=1 Tax=Brevibacillus laterosporus TaxID=1465 RepID=UPI003D2609AD